MSTQVMQSVSIARVDPRLPGVTALIAELDRYMAGLYPAESNHLVDVETLAQPHTHFFAAAVAGDYRGCGAIMLQGREEGAYAEVKRIFVSPRARGLGLGRRIIETLIDASRAQGITLMRLETGTRQPEALGLFAAMGFSRRGPFGDYPVDDPLSVFMERRV
jgi:putative acetyltransferase